MGADYPPDPYLSVRAATPSDAPTIAALARASMPDDPSWEYRYPHRHRYPDDHRRWLKRSYEAFFEQADRYYVEVVVAADNEGGDDVPIAFAVWIIDATVLPKPDDEGVPMETSLAPRRRDVNPAHFRIFREEIADKSDAFFGHYGASRLELKVLGTHPLFRNRGAGSLLVRAGLDRARAKGVPTTVMASPMGKRLYISAGFKIVGGYVIRVDGEEDRLRISVLEHRSGLGPFTGKRKCEEEDEREEAEERERQKKSGEKVDEKDDAEADAAAERQEEDEVANVDDLDVDSIKISLELDL